MECQLFELESTRLNPSSFLHSVGPTCYWRILNYCEMNVLLYVLCLLVVQWTLLDMPICLTPSSFYVQNYSSHVCVSPLDWILTTKKASKSVAISNAFISLPENQNLSFSLQAPFEIKSCIKFETSCFQTLSVDHLVGMWS